MNISKEYRRCRRAWRRQVWIERLARFDAWLQRFKGAEMSMSPCFKQDIKERVGRLGEASEKGEKL